MNANAVGCVNQWPNSGLFLGMAEVPSGHLIAVLLGERSLALSHLYLRPVGLLNVCLGSCLGVSWPEEGTCWMVGKC